MRRYFYVLILLLAAVGGTLFVISGTSTPALEKDVAKGSVATFGGVSLTIEFATTTIARERGLGGRTSIPKDYGMLFEFVKDDFYGFWMKDTLVPLDIFWLDPKGQVVHLESNVSPSSYPHVFYPLVPARYVLETAAGFAKEHNIDIGTSLYLQKFEPVSE
jgi:uncharacterized protein